MKKRVIILPLFFVLFLFHISEAASPTVGTVTVTDPINLVESSTVAVLCNASASDVDGWANITTVNSTIWHSSSSETAADDENGVR